MNVQLFVPCFIDQIYPHVAFNTIKLLKKAGCSVSYNPNQTCCGQPAYNAGYHGECKEVAVKFLNDFKSSDVIVAPSASCIGFLKHHFPQLFLNTSHQQLANDTGKKAFELCDFLVNKIKFTDFNAKLEGIATYHSSCAALRECKIISEPLHLLSKVDGLTIKPLTDSETCCGFGGSFAVKFESISVAMADQKINHVEETHAEYLISTDMSCLMHLEARIQYQNKNIQCLHIADVLTSGW